MTGVQTCALPISFSLSFSLSLSLPLLLSLSLSLRSVIEDSRAATQTHRVSPCSPCEVPPHGDRLALPPPPPHPYCEAMGWVGEGRGNRGVCGGGGGGREGGRERGKGRHVQPALRLSHTRARPAGSPRLRRRAPSHPNVRGGLAASGPFRRDRKSTRLNSSH